MVKSRDPELTLQRAAYLHRVAAETRLTASQMDQVAGRWERELEPKVDIPCCKPGACMVCGIDSPPGHCHVDLPDSPKTRRLTIGRVCSSHTLWELAMTQLFTISIEGEADHE